MSKMRARYHELVAEQSKLKDESERLIGARSQALIEGTAFTEGDKIRSLHDDIIAIDAAIATVDEQAKVEEARDEARIRAQSLLDIDKKIDELTARYVKLAGIAQTKMLHVVGAFEEIHRVAEQLNQFGSPHSSEITGVISAVDDMNVQHRLSEHLQDALARLRIGGYGSMQWIPHPPTDNDWSKQESDVLKRAFTPARQTIQRKVNELLAKAGE
jgi:hypothetical protein